MDSPTACSWLDYEPVTPDWLNEAEHDRYPASMEFWYPRLREVESILLPDTEWVELRPAVIEEGTIHQMYSAEYDLPELRDAVKSVGGPPAFLRTDMASNGLDYGGACIDSVETTEMQNVAGDVIHFNTALAEVPFSSLAVREWLDIVSFGRAEFGVEVRVFISDGCVEKWGFYWPEEETNCTQETYQKIKKIADDKGGEVLEMAKRIAHQFEGVEPTCEWSVDFVLTEDDSWYCTDMAPAVMSMTPPDLKSV